MRVSRLSSSALVLVLVLSAGLAAGFAAAGEGPDQVVIDSLADLYRGVDFDHALHEELTESCAVCHHHTTGDPPASPGCQGCHAAGSGAAAIACRDCHLAEPFSAGELRNLDRDIRRYHTDKVGLKGAYHLSCRGCHEQLGGPVGCEECHARTDAGEAFFHAGPFAPATPVDGNARH